ncbi:MAG: 4-phosphopantetheinyl transferase [Caulobacteraceae bacterium]|jgi:4'-phosphopantetheinyl transferase|nr:4-phosphopantetheinyl transferase [Caulobacteraceae bacterium]
MRLGRGEIAVWTAALDGAGVSDCLAPEERARADFAIDPMERRRRVCSRSVLRHILGAYVGLPAAQLEFVTAPHGKPRLVNGPEFNLSHSGETMLLAVSGAGPVGVDVEPCGRLDDDWRGVTRRTFSDAERAQLEQMPDADRPRAALRGWVRKEAYAKARGEGFAYGFPSFTVRLDEGAAGSMLVEDAKDDGAVSGWRLLDLVAPLEFAASLAHGSAECVIAYRSYETLHL